MLCVSALVVSSLALQQPFLSTARGASRVSPLACSAVDRRSAVLGALGCGLLAVAPSARAYDAIPEVSADFEKLEKLRAEAIARDAPKVKLLNAKVKQLEGASTTEEFV